MKHPLRRAGMIVGLSGIAGCDYLTDGGQRRWAGFTLGEHAPDAAKPTGEFWPGHQVALPTRAGFPWQSAVAQLDAQGRVMAVTLTTTCCDEPPTEDIPPSDEEVARRRRAELAVPDRFRDGVPPPVSVAASPDTNRVISWRDMLAYGRSALRAVVARLGKPATARHETAIDRDGQGLSFLDDRRVFRARWSQPDDGGAMIFAMLDVGKVRTCLTIAAGDIPHPPIVSGCDGLDQTCIQDWYPAARPVRINGMPLPVPPSPPPDPRCTQR